jgi:hypothetical protein
MDSKGELDTKKDWATNNRIKIRRRRGRGGRRKGSFRHQSIS